MAFTMKVFFKLWLSVFSNVSTINIVLYMCILKTRVNRKEKFQFVSQI